MYLLRVSGELLVRADFEGYLLDEANVRCIAVYMHGSGSTRVTVGRERPNEWGNVRCTQHVFWTEAGVVFS